MSCKLDSPVYTQFPFNISPCKVGYHGDARMEGEPGSSPAGRRHVFSMTETGASVLGMDLDGGDRAHVVKQKFQIALHMPSRGSTLSSGDMIFDSDPIGVQKDAQGLLTNRIMHRSKSTPCFSLTGKSFQQRDDDGLIEILVCSNRCSKTKELAQEIVQAIKNGVEPTPVVSGLGGAYYFRNRNGDYVAIVKPTDEEPFAPNNPKGISGKALGRPGIKCSVRVGETGFREVAAYLLDYGHFVNVPVTALIKIAHPVFNVNGSTVGNVLQNQGFVSKIASLQQFVQHDFDASDHGTSNFPISAVHRIGILDVRIFNTDRHGGNILVRKFDSVGQFGQVELVPIDHGLCLPECLEDPYFEWIHWPQASIPFSEEESEYIRNLDPFRDSAMLRREIPMIREACLRVLILCTIFLQEAAGFGLCLAEIGEMMSREFLSCEEEPSQLEVVCLQAKRIVAERELLHLESEVKADDVLFDIDLGDPSTRAGYSPNMSLHFLKKVLSQYDAGQIDRDLLPGPDRDSQDEETICSEELLRTDNCSCQAILGCVPTFSGLSHPLKKINTSEKIQYPSGQKPEGDHWKDTLYLNRSAKDLSASARCFVKLADMNEDEWALFLEKFKELLYPAFINRQILSMGQKQRQRLGTSCQF